MKNLSFSVYPISETDLDAADEVVIAAYNLVGGRKETLRRYLMLQPDGAFVVKDNETIVGFGAALDYGPFAYIGLMSVHPMMQKHGIGKLLMDYILAWLDKRGCQTVLLDASVAGEPLYLRYGFVVDDKTCDMRRVQQVAVPAGTTDRVSLLRDEEFTKLVAFDAEQFGASREALLAAFYADNPQRVFVVRDGSGAITGYVIAQMHTIGPWVANTLEDAELLLRQALTLPYSVEPTVFVSAQNYGALSLLDRYGYSRSRALSYMRKGAQVERSRTTALYGQASLGFG